MSGGAARIVGSMSPLVALASLVLSDETAPLVDGIARQLEYDYAHAINVWPAADFQEWCAMRAWLRANSAIFEEAPVTTPLETELLALETELLALAEDCVAAERRYKEYSRLQLDAYKAWGALREKLEARIMAAGDALPAPDATGTEPSEASAAAAPSARRRAPRAGGSARPEP